MKPWLLAIALVMSLGLAPARAWKPARAPLMTRWAKDVTPDNVHPEYPRPQLVRQDWLNLNGLWQLDFAKAADDAPPLGKELSRRILVPFPVESALSGVMRHGDRLWYRRHVTVPAAWAGMRTLLHFGAVDWEATVWLNGKRLGRHRGGYDPFTFDITDALKPHGEQELVVGVWDPTDAGRQPRGKQVRKPGGIFYTPTTGIWQTVWLEPVPGASIADLMIVPDVDSGKVRVTVRGRGTGAKDTVQVTALDGGHSVASARGTIDHAVELPIPHARLWSPTSPFLYELRAELRDGGQTEDRVQSYFGMRKIAVGKDNEGITRILLNGRFLCQVGPLDQGFWPDGLYTAPTDEALKYDIETAKKLGFNMARKHVKVEPDRWYYWCDRLGLLVWQDMPSGNGAAGGEAARQFERELRRMIDGRRNHPSVIMWVVFNEGWGQFDTKRLTALVKQHDPSRLANCASGWTDRGTGDAHDLHAYPGPASPEPEAARAAVLGEFGGLGLGVDGHTWSNKTWGYQGMNSKNELTRRYELLLRRVYRLKEKPGLSAAVYTQITDVETEANGLMTYDRAVLKVDAGRVAAVNQGDFSHAPQVRVVVPTSQTKGLPWRYTLDTPPRDWFKPGFDDSAWQHGPGGFGTKGTPGAAVRTEWKTADIWLRRDLTLPEGRLGNLYFSLHHDEDAEVYLNGVLAAKVTGYVIEYEEVPINREARAALKPGKNHIAVHCHQTTGGQYVDVGIVEVK